MRPLRVAAFPLTPVAGSVKGIGPGQVSGGSQGPAGIFVLLAQGRGHTLASQPTGGRHSRPSVHSVGGQVARWLWLDTEHGSGVHSPSQVTRPQLSDTH